MMLLNIIPNLNTYETIQNDNFTIHCFSNFLVPCAKLRAFILIDRSCGGKVVISILGKKIFGGIMTGDLLAAYNRIKGRKQCCLLDVLLQIKKWQVYFADDRKRNKYFSELMTLIKNTLVLNQKMAEKYPKKSIIRKAENFRRKLLDKLKGDKLLQI